MVTRFNPRTAAVLAGVAASLTFTGLPAQAQAPSQADQIIVQAPQINTRTERISYRDLNLATQEGEYALYRRANGAVERVCLHDKGRWYGLSVPDYNQCAERAWNVVRPQLIGAIYRARLAANSR